MTLIIINKKTNKIVGIENSLKKAAKITAMSYKYTRSVKWNNFIKEFKHFYIIKCVKELNKDIIKQYYSNISVHIS